jgi:hypothetical protein
MKQNLVLAFLILCIFLLAFRNGIPGKRYPMALTEQQWNSRIIFLQHGIVLMRTSSSTGTEIAAAQDSLVQFMQEIQQQVGPEILADSTKTKK